MKKAIFILCAAALLASCVGERHLTKDERATLYDFVEYCSRNEGLHHDTCFLSRQSGDVALETAARYYVEQENFYDVTDYWEMSGVWSILER